MNCCADPFFRRRRHCQERSEAEETQREVKVNITWVVIRASPASAPQLVAVSRRGFRIRAAARASWSMIVLAARATRTRHQIPRGRSQTDLFASPALLYYAQVGKRHYVGCRCSGPSHIGPRGGKNASRSRATGMGCRLCLA